MTVAELCKELGKYPPGTEVYHLEVGYEHNHYSELLTVDSDETQVGFDPVRQRPIIRKVVVLS